MHLGLGYNCSTYGFIALVVSICTVFAFWKIFTSHLLFEKKQNPILRAILKFICFVSEKLKLTNSDDIMVVIYYIFQCTADLVCNTVS